MLCREQQKKTFDFIGKKHATNMYAIVITNKVDVLHVRLTDLHAAHQNLPFPPNRTLLLKQYQYQGRL